MVKLVKLTTTVEAFVTLEMMIVWPAHYRVARDCSVSPLKILLNQIHQNPEKDRQFSRLSKAFDVIGQTLGNDPVNFVDRHFQLDGRDRQICPIQHHENVL